MDGKVEVAERKSGRGAKGHWMGKRWKWEDIWHS